MDKNHGVLMGPVPPSTYVLGQASQIQTARYVDNWSPFLPSFEKQYDNVVDFLECVTMSGAHSIAISMNYLLATNQMWDEALNFFKENGYIKDRKFNLSDRFNAKMNGTDKLQGQYLWVAAEHFRHDGFIPETDWSVTDTMTWNEFYKDIPQNIKDKAKKALWFITVLYQDVPYQSDIPLSLKTAPIQIATAVCPGWSGDPVIKKCTGLPAAHATVLYDIFSNDDYAILDQYPPYLRRLSSDYELLQRVQYIVSMKPITLREGMHGVNVLSLQDDLKKLGYYINADSFFGTLTSAQVRKFQKANGLIADGIAGPLTLQKIKDTLKTPYPSIKETISRICKEEGIEPELGIAVASCESNLDPKCININKGGSIDKGLFQWNNVYHPEISETEAFNPESSTRLFCHAVKNGNLHAYWSASEPCWSKKVNPDILKKYGIV